MIIDWFKLLGALALLVVPSTLLHGAHVRYRLINADWRQYFRHALPLRLHWIDLGRAAFGAWLLAQAVTRDPSAHGLLRQGPVLVQGAVFSAAVVVQTVFCRTPDSLHAPFAFVTGLVVGYFPPAVAGFGIMFSIVIAAGLRVPASYFPILAASVLGLGVLFTGKRPDLVAGAAALPLPWLLALLFRRRLMATYRSRRLAGAQLHPEAGPASPPISTSPPKS